MANVKKTETNDVSKTEEIVKEKISKTNNVDKEELLSTISEQNNVIEEMKKQLAEMQKAFISMQSNTSTVLNNEEDDTVRIGCRFINGVPVYSPKRDIEYEIKYGEENEIEVSPNEMRMLLKTNFVREFLRKDVLYFVNDSDYDKFKITNRFYLNDDELIKLVSSKNSNHVISELNKYTRDKRDDPVFHCLFYRIVKLSMDGKLGSMPYETRKSIEEYFQFTIDNAQFLMSNIAKIN